MPGRHSIPSWQLLVLLAGLLLVAGTTTTAKAASLPEGLESKPLIDQLLARKAFLKEHLRSDAWKQLKQQRMDARSGPHNERGVLIVAGGRDMFANAAITLTVLRNTLRSRIPVEIVHYGPSELPPQEIMGVINALNGSDALGPVYVTDALAVAPPETAAALHRKLPEGIKGFASKVYGLSHVTRFKKVMLLDADSMPLVDPELLFKVPLFQRTGSLVWPDFWHNAWVNASIYTLVGDMTEAPWVGKREHRLIDSGQMLFDRERHAEAMEYLWLLNSHHEWVYKHLHGDKDTFLVAFSMAGQLDYFSRVPTFARDAMRDVPGHQHKYHHLGMVQSMPPKMLAAALRASARAPTPGDASSSSSSADAADGAADGPAAAAGDTYGGEPRRLLAAATPWGPNSSSSSSSGVEPTTPLVRKLLAMAVEQLLKHTDSSSSSSDGFSSTSSSAWWRWLPHWARSLQQQGSKDVRDEGLDPSLDDDSFEDLGWPADTAAAAGAAAAGAPAGAPAAAAGVPTVAERSPRPNLKHVGVPVFLHRASFNSKWFPDCLNGDKIKTGYCEVAWVSVPLSTEQAGHSLKPHMYAFNENQVDATFYEQHCSKHAAHVRSSALRRSSSTGTRHLAAWWQPTSSSSSSSSIGNSTSSISRGTTQPPQQLQQQQPLLQQQPPPPQKQQQRRLQQQQGAEAGGQRRRRRPVVAQFGLPPELHCDKLPVGEDVMPIPVMPIAAFPYMERILQASYAAFKHVLEKSGVKV